MIILLFPGPSEISETALVKRGVKKSNFCTLFAGQQDIQLINQFKQEV